MTSDDLPDISQYLCFFGGGGNNDDSLRDPDKEEPDGMPGPGVKVKGGRGEDATGFLLGTPFFPDDLLVVVGGGILAPSSCTCARGGILCRRTACTANKED